MTQGRAQSEGAAVQGYFRVRVRSDASMTSEDLRDRVERDGDTLRLHRPLSHLAKVYIEPTNGCNLDCVTCFRNAWQANIGRMREETFAAVLEGIKQIDPPPTVYFGGIGARTTPFKTVRIDEVALQRHGITVETLDMSDVFARMKAVDPRDKAYKAKTRLILGSADCASVPADSMENLARLAVVLDAIADEYQLDAMGLRCWTEIQSQMKVSPCIVMGLLNEAGLPVACEVDVGNAVAMLALQLAADSPAGLLDWNNNYGDDDDKCILFHCGPMPPSMMSGLGKLADHSIIANAVGKGCSFGCNTGRILPGAFTFSSLMTWDGQIRCYLGEGEFTADPIPPEFFGCAGVAHVPNLQDVLLHIGRMGHRHHVAVTSGRVQEPLAEALGGYLGFGVTRPQRDAVK